MTKKRMQTESAEREGLRLVPNPEDEAESRLRVRRAIEEARTQGRNSAQWWGTLREVDYRFAKKPAAHAEEEASET